ncbi:MAG TPA: response regulator [Gaiellaceae bacterium]
MSDNGRPLILIADDDPDILGLISFRLRRSGYDVVEAHNGEEAVQVALERRPDLVILDVMMPRVDGYEATRRIRKHEETSRTPVILLTAHVQDADVARGFEVGADDYVRKPFSPQELGDRVQAALGR